MHNEELHNLYASQNIITVMTSRSIGWVGHVTYMREKRNAYIYIKPERKRETIQKT